MHRVARRTPSPRLRAAGVITAALLVAAGCASGRQALAGARPAGCPEAMPVGKVTAGMEVTGLTTAVGTAPERFDGEVLGTLADGIAPGVPMILVRTASRTIDRVGGVWAGMSGSPVYARDGRLVGAIAYGLAIGPSKIAGLTPAAVMVELAGRGGADADANRSVRLSPLLRDVVGEQPAVSPAQADGGMRQLPLPLGLSGLATARFRQVERALARSSRIDALTYRAAAAPLPASTSEGDRATIRPGANFAAALAYGDVTAAGVGTTTLTCGDVAVAFGHPFLFSGPTSLSAHGAHTVTIQDDPAYGPFKVANPGGVVGVVTADRLAGVRAQLDAAPRPTAVTSTVVDDGTRAARSGRTDVNVGEFVPAMAASHLLANLDRVLDQVGPGRSTVTWTASGAFGDGRPWRLERANQFSSRTDIGFDAVAELLDFLTILRDNEFDTVRFDAVAITAGVAGQAMEQRVTGLSWTDPHGRSRPLGPASVLNVSPGETVTLRVHLESLKKLGPAQSVELRIKVPAQAAGRQGTLSVAGGMTPESRTYDCLFDPSPCPPHLAGRSAEQVVRLLASQHRNDDVIATLRFEPAGTDPAVGAQPGAGSGAVEATAVARARHAVRGVSLRVPVMVAKVAPATRGRPNAPAGKLVSPPRRLRPAPAR